jgi:hypothetical protein
LLWQREDDMKVRDRQQFSFTLIHPGGTSHALALGAMPITAGMILNPLVSAIMAMLRFATELGGAAMDYSSQYPMLVG